MTNLVYTAKDVTQMFKLLKLPADSVDEILKQLEAQPLEVKAQ